MRVRQIEQNGVLLGIHLSGEKETAQTQFYTDADLPLQVGLFAHGDDYDEPLHRHRKNPREITRTHQVIVLRAGRMRVEFRLDGELVDEVSVEEGDAILLADGEHAIEAITEVEGFTVKQGPYLGDEEDVEWMDSQ